MNPMDEVDDLRRAFSGRLIDPAASAPPGAPGASADAPAGADAATDAWLLDQRRRWRGSARAIVEPDTAQDVAAIVRWCASRRVPVVPQGGNTGLVGGSVPDESGRAVLLSLRRLNRVRKIDVANATMTVEAGCLLVDVQAAADANGALFPLSLASEGSCTIGGNLSTNAGGVQVLRYGNARELCLGLEVVTPHGEIWNGLRGLRKDNTGYDLRDLFIGAEGTLGIITAATLKLFPRPAGRAVAFVAVDSPQAAVDLLNRSRAALDAGLTAFECMADACLQLVERHIPGMRLPLAARSPWYVLVEAVSHDSEADANERLQAALADAIEHGVARDAAVAASVAQARALWQLRENISGAQAAEGKNVKHDISLPISAIPEFIASTGARIEAQFPGARLITFGHLGDGNLHYNVSPPADRAGDPDFLANQDTLNRIVHDAVVERGGSISAEHGLGVLRRDESARFKQAVEMRMMHAVKAALDPDGLMNPGKVLPTA